MAQKGKAIKLNHRITPVMEFWGFKQHPFDDFSLPAEDIDLFVGRKQEIRRLQNALSNTLCGVYGSQGIGKSSALVKLKEMLESKKDVIVSIEMTGMSVNVLFLEILAKTLVKIKEGSIKLWKEFGLKVDEEIERVEMGMKYTSSMESSASIEAGLKGFLNMVGKAGTSEGIEKEIPRHDNDSALKLFSSIIGYSTTPFVVFIDNLERTKFWLGSDDGYFRFIAKTANTLHAIAKRGICFVVTLDSKFPERIQDNLPGIQEASSYNFGKLVEITNFSPKEVYNVITKRLIKRGWKESVESFIPKDAFWTLIYAAEGHPRRIFNVIREAMELSAEDETEKSLTSDYISKAAKICGENIDELDVRIFQFLNAEGEHSPSDKAFEDAVGIKRSSLSIRLKDLDARKILRSEKKREGNTMKNFYSLPSLDQL